jgi:hypothetical protein
MLERARSVGLIFICLCLPLINRPAAADPPQCPPDATLVGQTPYDETGPWQVFVSNALYPHFDPSGGVRLLEHFAGVGGPIQGYGWFGVSQVTDDSGHLIECPLQPGEFLVEIYASHLCHPRPDYETGPLWSAVVSSGTGLSKTDTGHVYATEYGNLTLWYWEVDFAPAFSAFEGWIAVQNLDLCQFWWAAAVGGDGKHFIQYPAPGGAWSVDSDLAFCLVATDVGPFTGACCDISTGTCRSAEATTCLGTYDVWHGDRACSEISCSAEQWACCDPNWADCSMATLADCEAASHPCCANEWHRFYVCSTTDPLYDPTAFGGQGNKQTCVQGGPVPEPITCETVHAFGRDLSGGYLYRSWDRGPGDQKYVIDNYTGFSGAINRVHWWGNSTHLWDGPDCNFAQPSPFVIKFYQDTGSGPAWSTSAHSATVTSFWRCGGYQWTGSPELGSIDFYAATLDPAYSPGTGQKWLSIASATADCDFIWAPGPDGTSGAGQWFYDNGVCAAEPGYRHRSFCLYTFFPTGACCNEITGTCQNGQSQATCAAAGGTFYQSMTCAQISGGCYAHYGACCDHVNGNCTRTTSANCTGAGRVWLGADSVCAECCVYTPPDCVPEGEPECFDGYVDTYDSGCDGVTPVFRTLAAGDLVCAAFGTFHENPDGSGAELRDSDWYEFAVAAPAVVRLHVKCEDALPVAALYQPGPAGAPCQVVQLAGATAEAPCAEPIVSAVEAGSYYAAIAPSMFSGVPCGTPYTVQLQELPAGACEIGFGPWGACAIRTEDVCLALGGYWYAGKSCRCYYSRLGDANCDGMVNVFDIDPFAMALANPDLYAAVYPDCDRLCAADVNQDGAVNVFDIDPFVLCLTGRCP